MDRVTIASAVNVLENLLLALNNAYWDANEIHQKDTVFDIVCILHEELNEMAKLSVEDHYMAYEPITAQFRTSIRKLKMLHAHLENWFPRTRTADQLEAALSATNSLLANQCL